VIKGLEIDEEGLHNLSPQQRDLAVGALRELEYKVERDPLSVYFPHAKQDIFHRLLAAVILFFGGNQSGKTTGGLADDLIQALDEEDLPEHLLPYKKFQPPFLCRIMAESFPVLETVLYEKLRELLPVHTLVGESWAKAYDSQTRSLRFKNGSVFFFQTYEMDVAKMGGASLDRVHYDEEPPEAVRNECKVRVMAREGDELFTMTPVKGMTWTYSTFWKKLEEAGEVAPDVRHYKDDDEEYAAVTVDMDDNPTLTDAAKRRTLAGYSKEERKARKEGKFVALHGRIYEEFSPDKHVIPALDAIPPNTNVVVGIDPGIRNRAAVVWAYLGLFPDPLDPEGVRMIDRMVVFAELYLEGYTVAQVAKSIHETNARFDCKPLYYVIDPAAANRAHQTGRSDQMEYADHGIVCVGGQHAVPAGINRVKERLERDALFIAADCVYLIEELRQYRWKQPPRSGEDGPQKPVKKDDHLMDALRYVVMSRPYLPDIPEEDNLSPLERMMKEDQENAGSEDARTEFGSLVH
jgi:phage terminase large subunit-like protein